MKNNRLLLPFILYHLAFSLCFGQTRSAVTVTNSTGALASPSNFFAANSNLLNQAVNNNHGTGGGGGAAFAGNPAWFFTNAAGQIDLQTSVSNWLYSLQTGSVNLTNWSALPTNILQTAIQAATNSLSLSQYLTSAALQSATNGFTLGQYLIASGGTGNGNIFTGNPLFNGGNSTGPGLAATFYSGETVTTVAVSNATGVGTMVPFSNAPASYANFPFVFGGQYWLLHVTSNLLQIQDGNGAAALTLSNINDSALFTGNLYGAGNLSLGGAASLAGALTQSNRYSYHTNATIVEPEIQLGGAGNFYEAFEFGPLFAWTRTVNSNVSSWSDAGSQHVMDFTNITDSIGMHGMVNMDSNLNVAGAVSVAGNISAANFGTAGQSNGLQFLGALGGKGSNNVLTAPATTNLTEQGNLSVAGATSLGNGNFKMDALGNATNAGLLRVNGSFTGAGAQNIFTHPQNGMEKLDINVGSTSDTDALLVMGGNNAYGYNYPAGISPVFQSQNAGGLNVAFIYHNITNANGNLSYADNIFSAPTWDTVIQTAAGNSTLTLPTSTNWSMSIYSGNASTHNSTLFGSNTCVFDVLNDGGGIETVCTYDHAFFHILTNGGYAAITNPSISPGQYMRLAYGGSNGMAILNLANTYAITAAGGGSGSTFNSGQFFSANGATNLQTNQTLASLHLTGKQTNDTLTASLLAGTDANKSLQSISTGQGGLTLSGTTLSNAPASSSALGVVQGDGSSIVISAAGVESVASFVTNAANLTGTLPQTVFPSSGSTGDNLSNYVYSVTLPSTDFATATNPTVTAAGQLIGLTVHGSEQIDTNLNVGGTISGNGIGLTNYQGSNLVYQATQTAGQGITITAKTNATIDASLEDIFYVQTNALNISNIINVNCLTNQTRRGLIHIQPTGNYTIGFNYAANCTLIGAFTTNWLPVGASNGFYTLAWEIMFTNFNSNTCTYAIVPPNK